MLLADLRLFARLSYRECADLLQAPACLLRSVWRRTRADLLASISRSALARLSNGAPRRLPRMSAPRSAAEDARFADDVRRAAEGDREARDRLWAEHYETLRDCAKAWFARSWRGNDPMRAVSLDGTEILHAVFGRLRDRTAALERGKSYFFRAFYTECLRVVVDHYRKTRNDKGRGDRQRVPLPSHFLADHKADVDFDVLFGIVAELEQQDARLGQIAALKVFESRPDEESAGARRGLTNAEVAELLGVSLRVVEKDWAFAKAWLLRRLGSEGDR
ncbi:MAG: hypothetical protein JNL08_11675 [Planctomycetes bacterium]|nr:hypothetical protein [Planctomycetota bacterium]